MTLDEAIEQMKVVYDYMGGITNVNGKAVHPPSILAAMMKAKRDLETATGALADIGTSSDMTLDLARNKAKRIYDAITAKRGKG